MPYKSVVSQTNEKSVKKKLNKNVFEYFLHFEENMFFVICICEPETSLQVFPPHFLYF